MASAALLASGCGASGDGGSESSPKSTSTEETGPAIGGKAVLSKLRGSVALIDTPIGSGSAVLTDDGYLVTNAHVVDPFDVADVTFDGDDPMLDVDVVGVDLAADIAVLGPVETDHDQVPIEDSDGLDQGSDLFLVGFPGDQQDPEVTITTGVLSRRREAKGWGLHFLQSDTKIAPGQSGGALVDDRGRVIGISGLSDEDDYALSLSGGDVVDAVDRIIAGKGSDWRPAPRDAKERSASFRMAGSSDYRILYFPATDDARRVTVGLDAPRPLVELDDVGLYPLAWNEAAYERNLSDGGATGDGSEEDLPEPTEPDPDGRWTFELEAGYPAMLYVGTDVDEETPLKVTTTQPFAVVAGDPEPTPLEAGGDPVEGTLGYLDSVSVSEIDLEEGDRVDILASSAIGDVAFTMVAPGDTLDDSEEVDDGGGGLFGLDAQDTYTATETGTYELWVYQVEGVATDYRLQVDPA